MKLALVIVQDTDAAALSKELAKAGLASTRLASSGGFLREGNTTLLIGVTDERLTEVKRIIKNTCQTRSRLITPSPPLTGGPEDILSSPMEVRVGGATLFVLDVVDFEKF